MTKKPTFTFLGILLFSLSLSIDGLTQSAGIESVYGVDLIIEQIQNLESVKDPKCHATANRLEDFMYGTPLSQEARNIKIDILKEVGLYVRQKASANAASMNLDSIGSREIGKIIDSLSIVGALKDGDFFCKMY